MLQPPALPSLAAAPRPKLGPRVDSLDLLRGIAILGIFLMNTQSQMLWWQAYYNPDLTVNDIPGDFAKAVDIHSVSPFTAVLATIFGPHLNAAAYIFTHLVADMKFITIFSFMFGAGIMLQGERVQSRGMSPWAIHYKRMAVLLCIALFHAYVIWYGDILVTYSMCGILLFPLRKLKPSLLLVIGLIFVSTSMLITYARYSDTSFARFEKLGYAPDNYENGIAKAPQPGDLSHTFPLDTLEHVNNKIWSWASTTDSQGNQVQLTEPAAFQGRRAIFVPNTEEENANQDPNNADAPKGHTDVYEPVYWKDEIKYRTVSSMSSEITYFWEDEFWRCGGCMLIGMALHRMRFFHGDWGRPAYFTIAVVGIAGGMAITGLGIIINTFVFHWNIFLMNKFGGTFNYVGSFLHALGYMSVGVLVAIRVASPAAEGLSGAFTKVLAVVVKPIRAIGKMALTNYLFQNIVGTTLAYAHRIGPGPNDHLGLAWYGNMERYQLLYIVPFVWAAQLALSTLWMRFFRQGPVEWAWHKVVYLGSTYPLRPAEETPTVDSPAAQPALA